MIVYKIRSSNGADPKILEDVANIKDGDRLIAFTEVGSGDEASFKVNSDTDVWLLTGNWGGWGFKAIPIKKTNEAEPVTIKRSSLKGEHKFAVVAKEPGDENRRRWCARRYQVEQNENATIKIEGNQDGTSGLKVSVVYGGNHEVPLSTSGELKVFDLEEAESRRRKINYALAIGAIAVTIICA